MPNNQRQHRTLRAETEQGGEEAAIETLRNVKAPLELGYLMVKNRGYGEDRVSLRFHTSRAPLRI